MALARLDYKTSGRVPTGQADEVVISDSSFHQQRLAYQRENGEPQSKKRKREGKGNSSVVYGDTAYRGPWARYEERRPDVSDDEASGDEEVEVEYEEDEIAPQPDAPKTKAGTSYEDTRDGKETTDFNGSEEFDYQGRTYMHIPQDLGHIDLRRELAPGDVKNYVPKKEIHRWKIPGAGKPINATRFFPDSGHLILSGAADAKVRLFDVYHQRELLRTYTGHTKAVTDIDFTPSGRHFLSASYDRKLKQWDTETGACLQRFAPGATPHVVRVNPSSPNEFLVGLSDKKILQYDIRTGTEPTQDYNYHLGAVNTITFCDENRRFMTTSDDKSLRAWEYGIPVPIKLIQEPDMFSMPRASNLHASGKYVAYQSSDNQIAVYTCDSKFRQNRKKAFRGHNTAGYAIDVAISPDGTLVASGDSAGFVCVWDWKTCKMFHKMQVGEGAITTLAWHPRETSRLVVGGLDGIMRYLD